MSLELGAISEEREGGLNDSICGEKLLDASFAIVTCGLVV